MRYRRVEHRMQEMDCWKALCHYFRSRAASAPVPSRELLIALVGVCGLIALLSLHAWGGH